MTRKAADTLSSPFDSCCTGRVISESVCKGPLEDGLSVVRVAVLGQSGHAGCRQLEVIILACQAIANDEGLYRFSTT